MLDTRLPDTLRPTNRTQPVEDSDVTQRGVSIKARSFGSTRLVCASRGDHLTRYLFAALARRYPVSGHIDANLYSWQRYMVALTTFHPNRRRWVERFYKSLLAYNLRSHSSQGQLTRLNQPYDVIFQIHALFEIERAPSVLYIDCTHEQSAREWPAWNPLTGRALQHWYAKERAAYQRAVHLFTESKAAERSLIEFYGIPKDRVTTVGAGGNFDTLPTLTDTPREPVILFVGNDFVRKGGEVLLSAFKRVHAQLPHVRLQILGNRHPIAPAPGVEVLGRIEDRQRVKKLFQNASVFCMPSFFEPFGLAQIEAMSYGLPCVSTTSCGIPEIVAHGETGLLVAPGDERALADALIRMMKDPAYAAKLGAAGRQRVENYFTWDHVVDRMAPVLDAFGPKVMSHTVSSGD